MSERFTSILVANRGEIALRVMKTARSMGYRTIAIASDVDMDAPHAVFADEVVNIGPGPSDESYLSIDKVIVAAKAANAEAIHPGYGFLSENATFAAAVREAGMVFIGPPTNAISAMGDKARAKRLMIEAGVPCIPGYQGADQSTDVLTKAAIDCGFPVMVKAAAGGGGRGMRLVHSAEELPNALVSAQSEAVSAFGSGELIIEKAVTRARHIEIQVFGDEHGSIVHLGERDCSLQRRNQKVIEEAPSPAVDESLRTRMGTTAVEAAKAVDYVGAGTVEFLLDDDQHFYFLEMNTRLQVEHPVTECVTGLDLVALQLKVAQGEPLPFNQDDVTLDGHAIEARLYAEDPDNDFLPSSGPIESWQPSDIGRTDAGIKTGGEISPFYDPMVAKVIAYGSTRDEARRMLVRSLQETVLLGPRSNRAFLIDLLNAQNFVEGDARTDDIEKSWQGGTTKPPFADHALAAVVQYTLSTEMRERTSAVPAELLYWSSSEPLRTPFRYAIGEDPIDLWVSPTEEGFAVSAGDLKASITDLTVGPQNGEARVDGQRIRFSFVEKQNTLHLHLPTATLSVSDQLQDGRSAADGAGEGAITAPMHGLLTEVFVEQGAEVTKGARVAVVEAMKMQHEIRTPIDGIVEAVSARSGDQVAGGQVLLTITPTVEKT